MELGPSAMPPVGYVAFCERQPWDCGAEPQLVLARAQQADVERAALFAAASPAALRALAASAPAAVSASAPQRAAPAAPALIRVALPAPAAVPATAPSEPDALEAPAATEPLRMSPQLWSKLNRINDHVNRKIVEATDLATYGKVDYWSTPLEDGVRTGDCEDYVLEKQRALLAAGLPRHAVNIALVTTPWGESHAVLLVATSEGELVLDNLSAWIEPWQKTGYRWRERQVDGDPFKWAMIQDPDRPRLVQAASPVPAPAPAPAPAPPSPPAAPEPTLDPPHELVVAALR